MWTSHTRLPLVTATLVLPLLAWGIRVLLPDILDAQITDSDYDALRAM
ncbi:MAG: hypothetical protein M1294_11340 [Firmicutes bacterium]|nr:hypothetical protein [Bacillota bacterium]